MKTKLFTAIAVLSVILTSCKKQEIKATPLSSLMITNVVNGGGNLVLGTNTTPVYNNNFQAYGMLTGYQQIKLIDTAGADKAYYNETNEFVNGGVYSLFLTGTPEAVESLFIKEENIVPYTDNVFGARVINLVTESVPISVNVQGSANGSFVGNLAYKAISNFKGVSALDADGDKVFEFRNAATGDLITSFTVPGYDMPRFRNITLAFAGGVGSEAVLRVNNY